MRMTVDEGRRDNIGKLKSRYRLFNSGNFGWNVNGKTIFFSSRMEISLGKCDFWLSLRGDGNVGTKT